MTEVFDLEIPAGNIDQIPLRIVAADIPGPVNPLRIAVIQRILNKGRRRPLRIPVIAKRHARSAHADLALPRRIGRIDLLVLFIQKKNLLILKRDSRRNDLIQSVFLLRIQHIIGTVACNLRRSVQIDVHRIRQILLPDIQLFDRHHLTREADRPHRLRCAVIQGIHNGDKTHRADRPDQNRGLLLAKIVHQLRRIAEVLPRNELHLRTGVQTTVNVLD